MVASCLQKWPELYTSLYLWPLEVELWHPSKRGKFYFSTSWIWVGCDLLWPIECGRSNFITVLRWSVTLSQNYSTDLWIRVGQLVEWWRIWWPNTSGGHSNITHMCEVTSHQEDSNNLSVDSQQLGIPVKISRVCLYHHNCTADL